MLNSKPNSFIVESQVALQFVLDRYDLNQSTIFTAAPSLLNVLNVTHLEQGISPNLIQAISTATMSLSDEIFKYVASQEEFKDRALTFARCATRLENLVYRANLLSQINFGEKIFFIDHPPLLNSLKSNLHDLLKHLAEYQGRVELPKRDIPKIVADHNQVPPFFTRLKFETWESVTFRVAASLPHWLKRLYGGQGCLFIVSDNGLIKETGARLALSGWQLHHIPPIPPIPPRPNKDMYAKLSPKLEAGLNRLVDKAFSPFIPNSIFLDGVKINFIERCRFEQAYYFQVYKHWKRTLNVKACKPIAVMTNYNASTSGEALFCVCQEENILHISAQHGTGAELVDEVIGFNRIGEGANSIFHLVYNEQAKKTIKGLLRTKAEVKTVGQPRDLADISRHRSRGKEKYDIAYISCQPLLGYNAPPSSLGFSDGDAVEWESKILTNVLDVLPYKVLYKPFRSRFYLDKNPLTLLADQLENVECFDSPLDLRYLLPQFRVIVMVLHAGSTLSWCLMSGQPVIFIHDPVQVKLDKELLKGIKTSGFLIEARKPDFLKKMREILSKPIDDIENEWRLKAHKRQKTIEAFIGITDGKAGLRIADFVKRNANPPHQAE